jgi:phospholipase A1
MAGTFAICHLTSLRLLPMYVSSPGFSRFYLFVSGALFAMGAALHSPVALAQTSTIDDCLRTEVTRPENDARTVFELRTRCAERETSRESVDGLIADSAATVPVLLARYDETIENTLFMPYKNNYIVFGSMENDDGTAPFSGQSLDIKFELGMKFTLFPQIDELKFLSPVKFGYSQRSWWDISESSAPFKEHNYNPEIFWDFTEALERPSSRTRLHIFDYVGMEHQSNGLDGPASRSWDRVYGQRELRLSETWGWTLKYWHILNAGDFNDDIQDYIGQAEITTHIDVNNWANINIKTSKGRETETINYQVDLIFPMSQWVNSRFVLSYYNGYGEALISYNKKTTSLRAGFYFPLGF